MVSGGTVLGGRYKLDERIASGGMGDVWKGTDEVLGRTVAVKILLPSLLDEPGFAERFRGEARTMATINHPGVVDVYDYGSDPLEIAMRHVREQAPPLPADVPPAVRAIVERAMAKDPTARYPTAAAFAEVARRAGAGLASGTGVAVGPAGAPVSGPPVPSP